MIKSVNFLFLNFYVFIKGSHNVLYNVMDSLFQVDATQIMLLLMDSKGSDQNI